MRRLALLGLLTLASPAAADECASYGPVAYADPGVGYTPLPGNARFLVAILEGECGGRPGAAPEFRVVAGGAVVEVDERAVGRRRELVPRQPLPVGRVTVETRLPGDAEWLAIGAGEVVASVDGAAPALKGKPTIKARAEAGPVPDAPGEVVTGWRIRLTAGFTAASDDLTTADGLLYAIDGKPAGADWRELASFRPARKGKQASYSWTELDAWGEAWTYRVRVRDAAGNEATGVASAASKRPARPAVKAK